MCALPVDHDDRVVAERRVLFDEQSHSRDERTERLLARHADSRGRLATSQHLDAVVGSQASAMELYCDGQASPRSARRE